MKNKQVITLPFPPSVNSMYRHNGNHTYITAKGQQWIVEAGYKLDLQYRHKKAIVGDVSLYLKLYTCGRKDIDNFSKATLDLFTKHGIWEDDSKIVFLQIEKIPVKHRVDQKVEIEIEIGY